MIVKQWRCNEGFSTAERQRKLSSSFSDFLFLSLSLTFFFSLRYFHSQRDGERKRKCMYVGVHYFLIRSDSSNEIEDHLQSVRKQKKKAHFMRSVLIHLIRTKSARRKKKRKEQTSSLFQVENERKKSVLFRVCVSE